MYQPSTLRRYMQIAAASDQNTAEIHADTFNVFCLIKKSRTNLNKPDLTFIIDSVYSLVRHRIAKNDSPVTAGPSIFAPCNFLAHTQPSGGTGSVWLPLIIKAAIHADAFNAFLFDKKKNRTKLNKPDLTLIIESGCSLVGHLIAKNDGPATAGPSIFAPCNFVAHTKPSGGTGSLRLPLIRKAAIHADTFNVFLFDQKKKKKKIRTKLNKPDLALIIDSGCS